MTSEQAIMAMVDALEASGVPYMVVGSLSSNFYGVPRSTQDADFVIQLEGRAVSDVCDMSGRSFNSMSKYLSNVTRRMALRAVSGFASRPWPVP